MWKIFFVLPVCYLFYRLFTYETEQDKEYQKKLKESMEDESIIDPETGVKLTLEEAESGHWLPHTNEFREKTKEELENSLTPEEVQVEIALNYFRSQKQYLKTTLETSFVDQLESTKTLLQYDGWTYSDPYKISYCNGIVILPAVQIDGHSFYENNYNESQLMFFIQLNTDFGHYYFRNKSKTEQLIDSLKNDDELQIPNYECFTFRRTDHLLKLQNILSNFNGYDCLNIEFEKSNLYIKTTRLINIEDILQVEGIIKNILSKSEYL